MLYEAKLIKDCDEGGPKVRRLRGVSENAFKASESAMKLCEKDERVFQVTPMFELSW